MFSNALRECLVGNVSLSRPSATGSLIVEPTGATALLAKERGDWRTDSALTKPTSSACHMYMESIMAYQGSSE